MLEKDEIENIKEHDAEEALRQRKSPAKKSTVKSSPKPQKVVVEEAKTEESKLERKK